jgi:hypothetical protein
MMIGVLTSNFPFYYDIIRALKKRGLPFISLTFNQSIPSTVKVIITTLQEKKDISFENIIMFKGEDIDILIDKAIFLQTGETSKKVYIGIDPGMTPGIAIFCNGTLLRRFLANSPEKAIQFVELFVHEWEISEVLVRIGHGARLVRNRIINMLRKTKISIEIVDETSTTSADDTLSAFSIAKIPGKIVERDFSLEPKKGEIRDIQKKSRVISGDITISESLAKKVLKGKIGLKEAITKQREK